ncbi:MAG TPA: YiiX/YebB-like N1pC/P60 family cysteine hydrolase, partial [Hyphomicrobiales bacterium]|nr:YiiX/YebB-like N1pC/P60 family cysteine hydrolase [Hyphomicrobiales bacterium]
MRFKWFILTAIAAVFALAGCSEEADKPALPHPDPETFQSGDLLWPALPGAVIPFFRTADVEPITEENEAAEWEREKQRFIEQARASGDPEQIAIANELENVTYSEFKSRYYNATGPGERRLTPFAAGLPQVGHVAIIEIDGDGERWVVEATPKAEHRYESLYSRFPNGVIRTPYDEWEKIHEKYNVWHGRVKDRPACERAAIANTAKQYLGRDYWFWSFNLGQENAFYCSKLVWLSVWK